MDQIQEIKIKALFHGILADWIGRNEADFFLPEKSTLLDLLVKIRGKYGKNIPHQLKKKDPKEFAQAFWAVRGTEQLKEPEERLNDGEEIRFFLPMAGG